MKKILAISSLIVGLATGGQAATLFEGSTSGTFTSPNGSNSCTYSNANGNGIAWGDAGSCPDFSGSNQDSRIFIKNYSFSESIEGHETVKIGEVKWLNRVNFASTAKDFKTNVNLKLNVTSPVNEMFAELLWAFIENTSNPTGDQVIAYRWDDFGLELPALLGPTLSIDGFSFKLLGDSDGESFELSDWGTGQQIDWQNKEHNWSKVGIYANVSEIAAVPLPAAGFMLIAAIGGLGVMRRTRKAA